MPSASSRQSKQLHFTVVRTACGQRAAAGGSAGPTQRHQQARLARSPLRSWTLTREGMRSAPFPVRSRSIKAADAAPDALSRISGTSAVRMSYTTSTSAPPETFPSDRRQWAAWPDFRRCYETLSTTKVPPAVSGPYLIKWPFPRLAQAAGTDSCRGRSGRPPNSAQTADQKAAPEHPARRLPRHGARVSPDVHDAHNGRPPAEGRLGLRLISVRLRGQQSRDQCSCSYLNES